MKQTRGLWASIIFVLILVVASLIGFASGSLKPKLGLDLEGGVGVTLSAPAGTDEATMNQALENIRNRVDAFGVGEPQIAVSGTNIDIQIPGSANGTVEQRPKDQYCLVGEANVSYGCSPVQATTQKALDELKVVSTVTQVCLNDPAGQQLSCYADQQAADSAKAGLTVQPKATPSGSASASASASPSKAGGSSCIVDATGTQLACYPSEKAATAAKDGATTVVAASSFCVVGGSQATSTPTPTPTPSPSASPKAKGSRSASASASGSASASPSPTPPPSAFDQLSHDEAPPPNQLPCGLGSKASAQAALQGITVMHETQEFCVVSSGGQDQGCYIYRAAADDQQRRTGQDRLLAVIGKTARLEQRPVIAVIPASDPTFATTPVTCATAEARATKKCSFSALTDQEVVYLSQDGSTKYRLAPVVLSGDQVTKATAVLTGGTQTQVVQEWAVSFELNGEGSKAFSDATTAAVGKTAPQDEIAIVVDREVISSPRVINPITNGSGQITGNFSEQEARDLATVLNAGALPVELTRQSVTTVSPTLGKESLRQGIVAALAGLILLFLYLLFYYRLLGIVAWFGMSIWAILALALVSLAGTEFGYALTLAGVAGLVISLGVTADSYIVFFERLKDEVRNGRSARSSVQPAFKRAYRTIVAADIVTGIAAVVLYLTAVSSVRGFALTLGVATLLDLFVVYFFKRPTVFLIARNDRLVNMRGFGLTSGVAGEAEPGEPVGGEA